MIDEKSIPQKSIFKSSEVCEIVGVKPYILRFWETEFVEICPIISSSGKKLFEKKDIILVSIIKDLLFSKKLTLEKAKFEISKIDIEKVCLDDSNKEQVEQTEELKDMDATKEIGQNIMAELSSDLVDSGDKTTSVSDVQTLGHQIVENVNFEPFSEPEDLIKMVPEIPVSDDLFTDKTIEEFKPQVSNEKIEELVVALDSIFEKSKSLKGQYQWL